VADSGNHRIQVFDPNGTFLHQIGPAIASAESGDRLSSPAAVAVNPQTNEVVVCDLGNHRIVIFDELGVFLRSFGGHGSSPGLFRDPRGVAITREGGYVVADRGNHRVQVFDSQGQCEGVRLLGRPEGGV